jgi:putative tricarboxylic transport membrane protein
MTEPITGASAGASAGTPAEAPGGTSGGTKDRAQYARCAALGLLGAYVLFDASRIGAAASSNDPIGPKAVPVLLGVALIVIAVFYALDVSRGGRGEAEEGEDVDLSTSSDWRTIGLLIVAFGVNAVLIEPLGWVISGALLFWGASFALGNRHHVRGLAIGVTLSLVTFYAFAVGLGVNLPAGILQGIL